MSVMNPQTIAQNWARQMGAASEKIKQGIQAVQESPTEKAAQSVDRMLAGLQRAVAEGRVQSGLRAVTLEAWKQDMLTKGLPRIASGATNAIPKFASFMARFIPHLESGLAKLKSMPRGDLEQNLLRANEMARHNAQFRNR